MKIHSRVLAIGLVFVSSVAGAHLPPPFSWETGGGGGGTQNVVAGPIKHRPVNNAVTNGTKFAWPTVELTNRQASEVSSPMLHVTALFLGTEWLIPSFAQDKIDGIDQFFRGYSGSRYSAVLDEYLNQDLVGTFGSSHYDGKLVDGRLMLGPQTKNSVLDQVCDLVALGRLQPRDDGTTLVAVFSTHKRQSWESCGWHGYSGNCQGKPVLLSFSYNLDNDSKCDVADSETGHSQGLAALANNAARALADVMTDSTFLDWSDKYGNEVDDKCAWTFSAPYETFPDGSKWKLQDLWSNQAYEAGTGHPNAFGQKGCVTGR